MGAKPVIKYVGGKTQLLPSILPLFPRTFNRYFEPFMGGGAVFFALSASEGHSFRQAYLNDWNPELVNMYRVIQQSSGELCSLLDRWKAEYLKDPEPYYYQVRSKNPSTMTELDRAARMVFLNKCGFNGLYRVNRKGEFNVPFGKHKNPTLCDRTNIDACATALFCATITQGDFEVPLVNAQKGDLVYFDPPYVPVSTTANFTSYTSDGFTLQDQERLARAFRRLADQGVAVVLSNSDTSTIRDLYRDFPILTIQARRAINSKGDGRGPVNEVLVLSHDLHQEIGLKTEQPETISFL